MFFGLTRDAAVDLGTASVQIFVRGRGVVLEEPSVAALDRETGKLLAVGVQAGQMLGRTPGNVVAVRPLRDGVISDYTVTQGMLRTLLQRALPRRLLKPNLVISVPSGITEVEERAVIDAGMQAGAKRVYLLEEPLAAAIGAGMDINRPTGCMVVDVGGGTTDIAVISMAGVVESRSVKVAGDKFDAALVKYIRRRHNLLIGEATAQALKRQAGSLLPREENFSVPVKGRCLVTGLPRSCQVEANELPQALEEPVQVILEAVHAVLESTPPELVADIGETGILLTGGGSLLHGFDTLLQRHTGIPTRRPEHPVMCVALGLGECLEQLKTLPAGALDLSRKRQLQGQNQSQNSGFKK